MAAGLSDADAAVAGYLRRTAEAMRRYSELTEAEGRGASQGASATEERTRSGSRPTNTE